MRFANNLLSNQDDITVAVTACRMWAEYHFKSRKMLIFFFLVPHIVKPISMLIFDLYSS